MGGVSVFSLGISFNYLVALFHHRPIRQANLIVKIVGPSPERHFGWVGLFSVTGGMVLGGLSLLFGLRGWEIARLWLWLLGSAIFLLVGAQLVLFRMLIGILDALTEREEQIGEDLNGTESVVSALSANIRPVMSGSDLH